MQHTVDLKLFMMTARFVTFYYKTSRHKLLAKQFSSKIARYYMHNANHFFSQSSYCSYTHMDKASRSNNELSLLHI